MGIPNVAGAIRGWTKKRQIERVVKANVDGFVQEVREFVGRFAIHIQPMPEQEVDRKPAEQRAWRWWECWIDASKIELSIDDRVLIAGTGYRVKGKSDWVSGGFRHYQLIEDYIAAPLLSTVTADGDTVTAEGDTVIVTA